MKATAIHLSLLAALWVGTGYGQEQEPEEVPIVAVGGPSAATELADETRCSPTKPGLSEARLTWKLPESPGSEQRIDVTMYRDGFENKQFTSVGPIPGDQAEAEFAGLTPGINYYWRVLTRTGEGWVSSETARCQGPICPADRKQPR